MDEPPAHRARKRFGQNFLRDETIIERIGAAVGADGSTHVVEIGPGRGALTARLLETCGRLDAIELDRDLGPLLQDRFGGNAKFQLHQADALTFDFEGLPGSGRDLKVVGNLPYNISTPLLFRLFGVSGRIQDMVFMLQKEVVDRLGAGPGEPEYGRLGIMASYHCRVEPLFLVPPGAFRPIPKVMSAVVRLIPHQEKPVVVKDYSLLERVVTTAFQQRRKTLRNALKGLMVPADMHALGVDSSLRPERISLEAYARLSDFLADSG